MPKGFKTGGREKGTPNKKTIWLLESLQEHGYDYEAMLSKFLERAAKGDRHALDMAHLLVKMVPYLANAPKQDVGVNQIDTLVINRFEVTPATQAIDTEVVPDERLRPGVEESTDTQSES